MSRSPFNAPISPAPSPQRPRKAGDLPPRGLGFDDDEEKSDLEDETPVECLFSFEELLSIFVPNAPLPADMDMDEDDVVISRTALPPVNTSPETEEEKAAKSNGQWFLVSRSYQARDRRRQGRGPQSARPFGVDGLERARSHEPAWVSVDATKGGGVIGGPNGWQMPSNSLPAAGTNPHNPNNLNIA